MPEDSASLIGHILDVQGSVFLADLKEDEEGVTPTVTLGDEDILVGRVGAGFGFAEHLHLLANDL